jgi:hypothetical protein
MTMQSANFDGSNQQLTIDDFKRALLSFITRHNVEVLSSLKKSEWGV